MLYFGTTGVNTSKATVVIGKLEPVMKDKVIYVISNQTNQATKIYVADWEEGKNSTVTDPWTVAEYYTYNNTTKTVKDVKAGLTVAEFCNIMKGTGSTLTLTATYEAVEGGLTVKKTVDAASTALVSSVLDQPNASFVVTNDWGTWTVTK